MNDLNLRVAAMKLCAHPKRFAKLRDAPVKLPPKWCESQADFVKKLAVSSSAEQVAIVKELFKVPKAMDFLADVLFACPLKHAVRNQLVRLFSYNSTVHKRDRLEAALVQSLQDIAVAIEVNSYDVDGMNDLFVSVSGCLQNFPCGRKALSEQIDSFVPLIPMALQRYWTGISQPAVDQSPTRRNEYYLFIQNLLRFYVNFLVEFRAELVPARCSQLQQVSVLAEIVSRHIDTPWDVRSIAGMAIGHNARFFDEFDKYMVSCQAMKDAEELPIKGACLLVLQKQEYDTYSSTALKILQQLIEMTSGNNATNQLVYMSKHLFVYSKALRNVNLTDRSLSAYHSILCELLGFALTNLSSSTDSVRHMSRDLLRNVLQHASTVGQNAIFNTVFDHFEKQCCSLSSSCLMLEQVVTVVGVQQVLDNCPSLFETVFKCYLGRDDSVDALYKCMMSTARRGESFQHWHSLWGRTLLEAASAQDDRLQLIERLITEAVQLWPNELDELLSEPKLAFSTKLTAMATVRRSGRQDQNFSNLLVKYQQQIYDAITGLDDHTRLLALRFVVETPKLSEPLTRQEREALLNYVHYNANNPSAHMRQIGYGLLQKALKRIELTLAQELRAQPNGSTELLQFLTSFMNKLALNLFPTANYGRRWLSLRLLRDCIEICKKLSLSVEQQLPTQTLPFLENCLGDSYEENKTLAALLLRQLQPAEAAQMRLNAGNIMELLVSLRPPDSATGAYQLEYYCQRVSEKQLELDLALPPDMGEPSYEPKRYRALQWCLIELKLGLQMAKCDLAQAAKYNPLYGLLGASRHFLQHLDMQCLAEEPLWAAYIKRLVEVCMDVSNVVLPVVSSASPEGHLPSTSADEKAIVTDREQTVNVLRNRLNSKALQQLPTTPQMVLLCAWRSIKEVSLILGELVERAQLQSDAQSQGTHLLSHQQAVAIGEHFKLLLCEIKHRGAFEQAYVGFTLVCKRFWQCDELSLNALPTAWLREAIELVCNNGETAGEPSKICPTRRSAGVPYMLQALICTELKLGTHGTFQNTVRVLLDVCERRREGESAARTHALNILRALFRCSELAELVGEYVPRAIVCALESFVALNWPEQNSATLLFAALLVRIFGVERARAGDGELHVRNRMTGRIFFTRYPELFDYFHDRLRDAGETIADQGQPKGQSLQLETMLLMLSRLYPSALEGTESSLNLIDFVPFLLQICRSHDSMTRERAAQVLGNFVDTKNALALVRKIVKNLCILHALINHNPTMRLDLNDLHGQLLQLLYIYKRLNCSEPLLIRMLVHTLALLAIDLQRRDIFVFNAILDVLIAIMEDAHNDAYFDKSLLEVLQKVYFVDHAEVYESCAAYAISPRFVQIYGLHLHRLSHDSNNMVQHILQDLVTKRDLPTAVQQLKVQIILYLLFHYKGVTKGLIDSLDIEEYQFGSDVKRYTKALSADTIAEVAKALHMSEAVRLDIKRMADEALSGHCWQPELFCQVHALLAVLHEFKLSMDDLMQRSVTANSELKPGLSLCIMRAVLQQDLEQRMWLPVLRFALDICAPTQSFYLRYKAAQLCELLMMSVEEQISVGDADILGHYMQLVIRLLVDEHSQVRNYIAEKVAASISISNHSEQANILPTAALPKFLHNMLKKLQKFQHNRLFLSRIFSVIVESFRLTLQQEQNGDVVLETANEDFEVFDRHETNIYCEAVRVVSDVVESFKVVFPNCTELMDSFVTLDALTSCTSNVESIGA
ncbi:thyroid adenoma-associated protein homolog [Scaptodrosophila lebanonensis]|uniref:tRNA (32-2'-O)-methyltransferase regulator THADA n=1 Tax=Drosophila lebanonensis TaxID=7225 RepID=A0A6J2T4U7_DROLE|nr:thyroid adenoma-associated protein homolog [Scaptodrosophila lebanonensis]